MASLARSSPISRPSCSLRYLRRCQTRSLSTSQTRSAQAMAQQSGDITRNMPKQKSMASRMKSMKRSEIPNDIGIVPATYVRPCGNMPSWFSSPMLRAQLEWLNIKQRSVDFMTYVYVNRWNQPKDPITGRRKTIPLKLRERYTIARDLHMKLNTALAEGDRTTLSKIACAGLANEQLARINRANFSDTPTATWTVKYRGWVLPSSLYFTLQSLVPSYFKSFHVVADRQISIPAGPGVTFRQIIFRVDSTQTLNKNDGTESITKPLREYLVIQQSRIGDEEEEDWKVWGTLTPTDTAGAKDIMSYSENEGGSVMDRLRSMWPGTM